MRNEKNQNGKMKQMERWKMKNSKTKMENIEKLRK